MKSNKGITLIALVITIIILLILAGITITLIIGDNGIINKAQEAKEQYNIEAEKEKLGLIITDIQIKIIENEQRDATLEDLKSEIETNHNEKYSIKLGYTAYDDVESINGNATYARITVKDKNYEFKVNNKLEIVEINLTPKLEYTYEILQKNGDKYTAQITFKDELGINKIIYPNDEKTITYNSEETVTITYDIESEKEYVFKGQAGGIDKEVNVKIKVEKDYSLKLNGGTYINTGIDQTGLLDQKSTIAIRVKINRAEQATTNYMNILGNHSGSYGFVLQFSETSKLLTIWGVTVDYTPYYDRWTDIVVTFNGPGKVYINGQLIAQQTRTVTPYGEIYIGTGYFRENRTMKGQIYSFKSWNTELKEEEVKRIDMTKKETNVQSDKMISNLRFDSLQSVNEAGEMTGTKYEIQEGYR